MTEIKVNGDTNFAAYARGLQNDWREKHNIPIGSYKNTRGEVVKLGSLIECDYAFTKGANFLSNNIIEIVNKTLDTKEIGAKIEKNRLFTNLLSSQPLAFNLFGEMAYDTTLATRFFSDLFPNKIQKVEKITFEHSSGRGNCEYTCDHSAFDVFVDFITNQGKKGFIGIEVKYAETLNDKPAKDKPRYKELSIESGLFNPNCFNNLTKRPIQQIWRDHLLSIAHLRHKKENYDDGFFIYLFPQKNVECQLAVNQYIKYFKSYNPDLDKYNEQETGFYIRYLDDFIFKLRQLVKENWTKNLIDRYLGM